MGEVREQAEYQLLYHMTSHRRGDSKRPGHRYWHSHTN